MKNCVYTALIGEYEELNEQPAARASDFDFICFTDNPELTSDTWDVILIEPRWPADDIRSARHLKVLGHSKLAEYAVTVWIDNSCILKRDPSHLLAYVDDAPIAIMDHYFRKSVLDEFNAVQDAGFDSSVRVSEQLTAYLVSDPDVLAEKALKTTVLVRRDTPELRVAQRIWMDHILRFSRRDQLSVNLAMKLSGTRIERIYVDLQDSDWISWPHTPERNRSGGIRGTGVGELPPAGVCNHLINRERVLSEQLRAADRAVEVLRAEASSRELIYAQQSAQLRRRNDRERERLTAKLAAANSQLRMLRSSKSWILTKPLRRNR